MGKQSIENDARTSARDSGHGPDLYVRFCDSLVLNESEMEARDRGTAQGLADHALIEAVKSSR